jgi:putative ABC transport system ATP-binding protein
MENILAVRHLTKTYVTPSRSLTVLEDVSFELKKGQTLSIVGTSGSGKTTLLGLCAGLDLPSRGDVELTGIHLGTLDEDERARLRNQKVGFIFQDFQLIPTLTALENVALPLELQGVEEAFQRAKRLLDRVGLGDRIHHYPNELSGGEQQRVSLARAFSNEPTILFADEPTGNLDEETSVKVEDLIFELNREAGTTLVLVTHDLDLASRTEREIRLKGGRVVSDKTKANV